MTKDRTTSLDPQGEPIADRLRERLDGVEDYDGYFKAFCPAHNNTRTQALSVKVYDDGVWPMCHGNPPCSTDAILAALGMDRADLKVSARITTNGDRRDRRSQREAGREAFYCYPLADGSPHMRVHRTADKHFFQQRYDAEKGEYIYGLDGIAPILYHADKIAHEYDKQKPLFIVEGEKDADRLIGEGLQATTNPMGAGKWRPEYINQLEDFEDIRIIPDNDEPGRHHAEQIRATMPRAKIVQLPDLPPKGDVSDWLDGGHTSDELLEVEPTSEAASRPPTHSVAGAFNRTDLGNARRLVYRHGHNLRYCWLWSKWLVWDGRRWVKDDSGEVFRLAKETVASIYQEAARATDDEARKALAKHAMRSEAGARIKEMVDLARSDVPVTPDQLDASPDLLNVENGTIDLRSGAGELREHRREDLITKIALVEYRPDAPAPTWGAFLERVLPGEELRSFVQRAVGYSATGDTSEQCMFINHGVGANGKSTFQEAVAAALGDYAMRSPTEMLMAKRSGGVPNDIARLKGARFVTASETEEGRRLAESLVKDLTGQDTISARFMRAEWFDFKPTHKLHLSTNHKPEIRGTDLAIWRRIRLVPWSVGIPPKEQDKKLPAKLRGELPGILAWIVRGCLEWRRQGLQAPDEVRRATVEYRAEMDVLGDFLEDRCIVREDASVPFNDLWEAYRNWCIDTEERRETKKQFGLRLTERGFVAHKGSRGVRIRRGLQLKDDSGPDDAPQGGACATPENPSKTAEKAEGVAHGGSENNMTPRKSEPRGVIEKSEPHAPHAPHDTPLSSDLQPGESASLEELRKRRALHVDEDGWIR